MPSKLSNDHLLFDQNNPLLRCLVPPSRYLSLAVSRSYAPIGCDTQRAFMKWSRTSYDSKKEHSRTRENEKRDTKSPSIITAKKYLQAVVSSGRGSRNALKNYLAYQGAFTPKIKGQFTHQIGASQDQ